MNTSLIQLLLLNSNSIQSNNHAALSMLKEALLTTYRSIKRPCNVATLIGGFFILLSISPFGLELSRIQNFLPALSFVSFLVITSVLFLKWRLSITFARIEQAIQQKEQCEFKEKSTWDTTKVY